jgi:hypothetical protein
MRYVIALGLAFALGLSQVAFADGWGTNQNGYGQYHESNN